MRIKKNIITNVLFILFILPIYGQGLPMEIIVKEVNRQIFDTDGQGPGFWTLTNKHHGINYGKIKAESITYTNDEKVFREYDVKGNMVRYQVYMQGKLTDDFTYEYTADGSSLSKERGTYNLDYFQIDSINYIGVNATEKGIGFTFNLDTVFVKESLYTYELIRKKKPKDKPIDRYVFQYKKDRSLLRITIYANGIQVGHVLNKYNNLNQVTERENFWDYDRFATDDGWSMFLHNRLHKFEYDKSGIFKSITTENYDVVDRKWEVEVKYLECALQTEYNTYIANCITEGGGYIHIEIDDRGNWILKEELVNGETNVAKREITYYD